MIVFGSRRNNKVMGQIQYICSRCQRQAYHTVVRTDSWFTLYFIPLIPLGKTTIMRCNLCGYQTRIGNEQADAWFQQARASTPDTQCRGADIRQDLTITFEEAVFGCQKAIELWRWETCPTCKGNRAQSGTSASPCSQCAGKDLVHVNRRVIVNIPAGVDSGINVRVIGEGHAGPRGGPPENLYVVLAVQPHPFFKRQGNDIIYELPVSTTQAVLGGEVVVPVVGGKTTMFNLPPQTQNGQVFRLKGMGIPVIHSNARGDQQIIVKVTQ